MAGPIGDLDIGDLVAFPSHTRRQKTMQPVEIGHRQKYLAPKCLQAAAGVAGAVAQNGVAHTIGDARLDLLETAVLAPVPLPGGETDAIAALFDGRDKIRQE